MNTTNPNIKLFEILNDNFFWGRYKNICTSTSRMDTLLKARRNKTIPRTDTMREFIKDFKYLEKDTRPTQEILIEMMQPCEEPTHSK